MGTHVAFAVFCQSKAILKVYFCKNLVEGLEVAHVEGAWHTCTAGLGRISSNQISSELATQGSQNLPRSEVRLGLSLL